MKREEAEAALAGVQVIHVEGQAMALIDDIFTAMEALPSAVELSRREAELSDQVRELRSVTEEMSRQRAEAIEDATMTERQALRIILLEAGKSVRGTGCGIRENLTEQRRKTIMEAAAKLWPRCFGRPFDDSDRFNFF